MNVIDLFSGVGGFSIGLIQAGYNIVLANEIDSQIAASYKHNHPNTLMVNCDINSLINNYDKEIKKSLIEQNLNTEKFAKDILKINLIVGGPPCQGFSMAGSRIRKSNEFIEDPRNQLFKSYFKIIQKFEPEYFVFENVVGILSMDNGKVIQEIEKLFETKSNFKQGKYYLQKKIFNANEFGVPQKRKRVLIIGSKTPFEIEELITKTISKLPKNKKALFNSKTTVYDAISDIAFPNETSYEKLAPYQNKPNSSLQKHLIGNSKKIYNHIIPNHSPIALDRIKRIKAGQNWKDLAENDTIKSVHSGAYGRLNWGDCSVTITTRFDTPSAGRFIHPVLNRNITPREAARIQTFPDNVIFTGNKTSICKQIGNAVPPLLAEFIGYLINELNNK
jgi:DNA (cytosine-5)-methyltransferase 1